MLDGGKAHALREGGAAALWYCSGGAVLSAAVRLMLFYVTFVLVSEEI